MHNFKYNYDEVVYNNATTHVNIKCPTHGIFSQTPDIHLIGSGCSKCKSSKPINMICNSLTRNAIEYVIEKTFDKCRGTTGKLLRFDIFVPQYNMCIEYDGPHHFKPIEYGLANTGIDAHARLIIQQQHDSIKDEFCSSNNIILLRIPYTDLHPDATCINILSQLIPDRFMYTYDDMSVDIKRISQYIKSFGYDKFAIYGIARGGLLFSVALSYHFDEVCEHGVVTFQRYDGKSKKPIIDVRHSTDSIPIFVVDDLISSGETMSRVVKTLKHSYKNVPIHPIVVFGEENDGGVFFINDHPKQWIIFPYEI